MFSDLIGNTVARERLRRLLEAGRVPGALLFAGAPGVGKKLFAVELAKALNCLAPVGGVEACDACAACVRIARLPAAMADARDTDAARGIVWGDHRDVGAVVPAGRFIKVEQVREVEREVNFRPYEGKRRVLIFDDAERLNESAANALLKTLEEMPPLAHVVLVTPRPGALLPTIRSRCQMLRFAPLSAAEIEAHLINTQKRAGAEANLVARLARGNLADALAMNADLYRTRRDEALGVLEALSAAPPDRARLLRTAEEWNEAKRKDDYEATLDTLEIVLHDVWLLALGADKEMVVNADAQTRLKDLSARLKPQACAVWLRRIEELRRNLGVNLNRRVAIDALLLSMSAEI